MTWRKRTIPVIIIMLSVCILGGCWNYSEINESAIVVGAAIDKDFKTKEYIVTVEIMNPKATESGTILEPVIKSSRGDTVFEAARNMVVISGKKLYWSHAKAIIISLEVAKEDLIPVLDFFNRDAEAREDLWILISQGQTAKEILSYTPKTTDSVAFQIHDVLKTRKALAKYDRTALWNLIDEMMIVGNQPTLPMVIIAQQEEQKKIRIKGTAVIKEGKYVGQLDEIETRSMLWIKDEIEGGVLMALRDIGAQEEKVSLELFGVKTELKPERINGQLVMNIHSTIKASIAEITGTTDYISKEGQRRVKKYAEKMISDEIKAVIHKAQKELNADIFGFAATIQREMPDYWKVIEDNWDDHFPYLKIKTKIDVEIRGSALKSKPIRIEGR